MRVECSDPGDGSGKKTVGENHMVQVRNDNAFLSRLVSHFLPQASLTYSHPECHRSRRSGTAAGGGCAPWVSDGKDRHRITRMTRKKSELFRMSATTQ